MAQAKTDELLTAKEAAELLRLKERTLADWRLRGVGPRWIRYTARGVRYRRQDVEYFLKSRERTSTSDSGAGAARG